MQDSFDKDLASESFGRLQDYIDLSFNYVLLKMFHLEITQQALWKDALYNLLYILEWSLISF